MPLIQIFVGWWKEHWDTISLILLGAWNIIKGIVQLAWSIVYGIIKVGIDLLTGKWGQAWEDIKDLVSGAWNGIKNIFIGALQFIGGWAGTVFHDLVQPFKDAWNAISDLVNKIKNALDFTKRHSPSVVDIVKNGVSKVNDALGDLAFGGTINASAAGAAVSNGGNQNSTVVVRVDMAGAFIADAYGANQMAELVGDGIIKRLQGNARI
jgi:phage-related protein